MSIPTFAPAPLSDDTPIDRDARAAGIADAYDEQSTGDSLDALECRQRGLIDHLHHVDDAYTAYVLGYTSAVISMRLHQQATSAAQTHIAFQDHQDQEPTP